MNDIAIEHEAFQQIANPQRKVERSQLNETHQFPSKPINPRHSLFLVVTCIAIGIPGNILGPTVDLFPAHGQAMQNVHQHRQQHCGIEYPFHISHRQTHTIVLKNSRFYCRLY